MYLFSLCNYSTYFNVLQNFFCFWFSKWLWQYMYHIPSHCEHCWSLIHADLEFRRTQHMVIGIQCGVTALMESTGDNTSSKPSRDLRIIKQIGGMHSIFPKEIKVMPECNVNNMTQWNNTRYKMVVWKSMTTSRKTCFIGDIIFILFPKHPY